MKNPFVLKWIKELIGIPTYLSVIIIGMVVLDGGILATLACALIAAAIYNALYEKLFPGYIIDGKMTKLFLLLFFQISVWSLLIFVLSK